MKNIALLLAVALAACHPSSTLTGHRVGINLGKQNAAITLATGLNNNVAIAPLGNTTTYLRFATNSAGSTVSGMDATTVSDGDWFVLRNEATGGDLTLTNEDTNSTTTNRMLTPGAVSLVVNPRGSAIAEYDGTLSRWMVSLGTQAAPTFTGNVTANGGGIPVLSTCGTSPSIVAGSTSFAGNITTGSAATTCTLTFAKAFGVAPTCLVLNATAATVLIPTYSTSTTALTLSVDIASTAYQYMCVGH
jgi:hypothetical protein